jgi:hypothetical protein
VVLARGSASVLHDPLGRQFGGSGFLAHFHISLQIWRPVRSLLARLI